MSLQQLRNVNFGRNCSNATGSSGVGYTILDVSGSVVTSRSTVDVYQLESGSGLYAAYVNIPDSFRGQIMWDTGTIFATKSYAVEQINVEENNPIVADTHILVSTIVPQIQKIYDVECGRWKIVANQMIFYKEDNLTEVTRFNLYDDAGNPSSDAVFERQKV